MRHNINIVSRRCIFFFPPSFFHTGRQRETRFIFPPLIHFALSKACFAVCGERVSISSAATSSPHVKLISLYTSHLNSRYFHGAFCPRAISFPRFLDTLAHRRVPALSPPGFSLENSYLQLFPPPRVQKRRP